MDNSKKYRELVALFDKQLEFAQNLQKKIIPKPESFKSDHYHFYSYLRPFRKVGGDFYDFHLINKSSYNLIISDATGHGIDAAMITSMIKLSYSHAMQDNRINQSPCLVLKHIESDIEQQFTNTFFTTIGIFLDPESESLYYANAGHPSGIVIKSDGTIKILKQNMPMLGLYQLMSNAHYYDMRVDFSNGDKLILFTDGLTDARNHNKEEFTFDRILSVINDSITLPVSRLCGNIINSCLEFKQNQTASDDICLIGIEYDH